MAEMKNRTDTERGGGQALANRERGGRVPQHWYPTAGWSSATPFEIIDRMSEEMDRVFDRVFRGFGSSRHEWLGRPEGHTRGGDWLPRIEAFQKGDRFVVKADLPGLKKDDIQVEVTDDALTIQGERREEHQEEREGLYRSERQYGHFYRTVPLPDGVISESAQATFRDGVLEVSLQAPPSEANRGRRLEIKEGPQSNERSK
jgi:HSP20 family protein